MSARLLIVEDEPLIALDIETRVTDAGFNVVGIARRAGEALEFIERQHIDIAILDANLGGTSAEPVARRLRTAGIPFVAVSGYSADQLGDWLEGSPLLCKPYAVERLLAELARLHPVH